MNRTRHHKGRGALTNPAGRFEPQRHEEVDDGWSSLDDDEEARPITEILEEATRSIIARNDSPDVPFDQSVNPYKGCEHGCIYCFARPAHAYLGLSAGLDFETKIVAKRDAAKLLRRELGRRGYQVSTLALGANTDPYQPLERRLGITRAILALMLEVGHPVAIVTKSALVTRDLDLLAALAELRLTHVLVSITTLDPELARRMEPRASGPRQRLRAIERLTEAGVPCGVLASPMIPGLNDHELERIVGAAAAAGAQRAGTIFIRLPHEVKELFEAWLTEHYPNRRDKVLRLIREARGGELYESAFGVRMRGRGPYAELLQRRFDVAVQRHGLSRGRLELDTTRFRAPRRDGQLALF